VSLQIILEFFWDVYWRVLIWEFFVNSIRIFWEFFGNFLGILLEFFGDVCLGVSKCVSVDFG
jgi:hypothetical protein